MGKIWNAIIAFVLATIGYVFIVLSSELFMADEYIATVLLGLIGVGLMLFVGYTWGTRMPTDEMPPENKQFKVEWMKNKKRR